MLFFSVGLYRVVPFPQRIAEYLAAGTYCYMYVRVHMFNVDKNSPSSRHKQCDIACLRCRSLFCHDVRQCLTGTSAFTAFAMKIF